MFFLKHDIYDLYLSTTSSGICWEAGRCAPIVWILDLQSLHMWSCFFGCGPNFLAKDTQNLQQVLHRHYPGWGGLYHFRVAWTHYFWIWKQENFGEMMGNDRKRVADFSYPHWGGLHGVHVTSRVMVDNHIASGALCISISMVDNVLSNLFRSGMWESYMFEVCLAFRKIRNSWDLQQRKESVFLYNFCQEVKACNTEPCNGETKHLVVKL